ncbi:ArnT family glycosyltransferase [Pseudoxanthomonas indica]|uniref:4-amino-4-deoxy-L-arabinose transferase n=1 Tax=Pseudoxanthomonas indica TaxID=428993 RepID=A0A1T5LU70_9GAMM|nr:glycosyltransferase family 39 protein [Pseudoxanthomonas indica]GGD39530.1 membrane protein [Pseudoxanthomonas indica]SKC79493.1 4-amino-4-deoxy-L-arabinose transferase [Pseudoxanthomonas indica]
MQDAERHKRWFLAIWIAATVIKVVIAARLPLFVDEAFYWQEGQHLAWAYSDLPGLNAWLARLGSDIGGTHVLALRAPFLLLAAGLPWLVIAAARDVGQRALAWQAGMLTVLMPLSGMLGLLALPDVPMAVASALCLWGGARLLARVDAAGLALLAMGLVIGALSHYRFVGVIGVGLLALLWLPQGRRLLLDWRVWCVLAIGAAAWWPLLSWNLAHADAGLRFQLVDRHPWSFQWTGAWFVIVQALLVTPLLFAALLALSAHALRGVPAMPLQQRYLGLLGALSTLGFFLLGFFADVERVSFHWPLPGYLALLVIAPAWLQQRSAGWRRLCWGLAALGLALVFAGYAIAATSSLRERFAAEKWYPYNFAGWSQLADAVREEQARLPAGTPLLAGSFKIGAELGFALDDPRIRVLDHPLNHKHGRAPQLALWGLQQDARSAGPALLILGSGEVQYKHLLAYYHQVCEQVGPLPPPRVINIDHGAQRFLLFKLPAQRAQGECVAPAMAYLDQPRSHAQVGAQFEVRGWAFKEGVGLRAVEVLLDGKPVASAQYGREEPGVAGYWKISNDPQHPRVGFSARVDASALPAGRHWLGLRLHGNDGSVEEWEELPVDLD